MKCLLIFLMTFLPLISYASASGASGYTDPYQIEYTDSYYSMYDRRKGETSLVMNIIKSRIGSESKSFNLNIYGDPELKRIVGKFWFSADQSSNRKDKGECVYKGQKVCEIGYEDKYSRSPLFFDVKKRKAKSGFDCSFVHFARFQSDWGIFEFNEVTDKWFRIATDNKENIYISRKEYFDNLKKIDVTFKAYLRSPQRLLVWKKLEKPFEEQKKKFIEGLKSGKIEFELNYVDGYADQDNTATEVQRVELVKNKLTINTPKVKKEDLEKLKKEMLARAIYLIGNLSVYDFILNGDSQRLLFEDQAFSYEPKGSMKFKKVRREGSFSQSAFRLQLHFSGDYENGVNVRFNKVSADVAVFSWGKLVNIDGTMMCDFKCFVNITQGYPLTREQEYEKELEK